MQNLSVSSSPHIECSDTVSGVMLDVILALFPAIAAGVAFFGLHAFLVIAVCVLSATLSEFLWCKIVKKPNTLKDLSAVLTGVLLGLNLPPELPLWMASLGGVAAIIVVKQMFGGIGHNFANPAITARIILMVSFPTAMTTFKVPFTDTVSSATPLADHSVADVAELFFGNHAGCIGETSALFIITGGIYLLIRRVISPTIPFFFLGSAAFMSYVLGDDPLITILTGGIMLAAFFMATDYVTSPPNFFGRVIFGIGCGTITVIIRHFGNLPEGVSFAVLLMNILTPHITALTAPKPFGEEKVKHEN